MNIKKIMGYHFLLLLLFSNLLHAEKENQSNQIGDDVGDITVPLLIAGVGIASLGALSYQLWYNVSTTPDIAVKDLAQEKLNFGNNFSWGVATASTQSEESSLNNSWSPRYLTAQGKTNLTPPGKACESFSQWQDDIEKLDYLGVNAYRLSIEWSRVQPSANSFDEQAINHYVTICQELVKKGIKPLICLHHYSDPIWFLEQGGFAQEKNIDVFAGYAEKMYEALHEYVETWIIISQPAAYAIKGYSQAMQPPFLKDYGLAETVMLNLFKAHIKMYDYMHTTYNTTGKGLKPCIGISHQITQMIPENPYNPLENLVANFADRLYNKSLLRFFTTGHLRCLKPMIDIAYIPQAPQKFDFFALSYYSPQSFKGTKAVPRQVAESHKTADENRVIDSKGMYDAIVRASGLGKPVIVVESGINPVDETQRILLLNSYLSAINQAIINKYDVRGYYYWTLMDNYEWGKPVGSTHFGLFNNRVTNSGDLHKDFKDHAAMIKDGGKQYKQIIKTQTKE